MRRTDGQGWTAFLLGLIMCPCCLEVVRGDVHVESREDKLIRAGRQALGHTPAAPHLRAKGAVPLSCRGTEAL